MDYTTKEKIINYILEHQKNIINYYIDDLIDMYNEESLMGVIERNYEDLEFIKLYKEYKPKINSIYFEDSAED